MDNGMKTVNAELRTKARLCPANANGRKTYRLTEAWYYALVPRRHFAAPDRRKDANYLLGCN